MVERILLEVTDDAKLHAIRELQAVLSAHPSLGPDGFADRPDPHSRLSMMTTERIPEFVVARAYLSPLQKTRPWQEKGPNRNGDHRPAFRLKYAAEERYYVPDGPGRWANASVGTGALIAAALALGIPVAQTHYGALVSVLVPDEDIPNYAGETPPARARHAKGPS